MTKNKKYYYSIGAVVLFGLSLTMFMLYLNDPPNSQTQTPPVEQVDTETNDSSPREVEESINITNDNDNDNPEDSNSPSSDYSGEELESFAREAITNNTLSSSLDKPGIQSFKEHARLHQYYYALMGENLSDEGEAENEAEWVAKELNSWMEVAADMAFSYSEKDFEDFINREAFLTGASSETSVLINELKKEDENLYIRHLEYKFIKPFVWESVKSTLTEEYSQDDDETDDEYNFRLFLVFEEKVFDYLDENHPELMQ